MTKIVDLRLYKNYVYATVSFISSVLCVAWATADIDLFAALFGWSSPHHKPTIAIWTTAKFFSFSILDDPNS